LICERSLKPSFNFVHENEFFNQFIQSEIIRKRRYCFNNTFSVLNTHVTVKLKISKTILSAFEGSSKWDFLDEIYTFLKSTILEAVYKYIYF